MWRAATGILLVAALTGAACTGERPELADELDATTSTTSDATTTTDPVPPAEVAEAREDAIEVFDDETSDTPSQEITAEGTTSAAEIPLVFLVKERGEERIEVYLPIEPAGSTGWVRAADVTLSGVPFRIEIELTDRRLRVFDGDDLQVDEPAGIGPDRPEPGDGIYLTELVQPPDDEGPYGTYAYGLAGSPALREGLEDGEGVVGIHGTDNVDLVGTDMPVGSIALTADVLARLVDDLGLPLGTPVIINE
jgi:hypothetical protein